MLGFAGVGTKHGGTSHGANRHLAFENLENRVLLAHSGLLGFNFTAPYDITTGDGVQVTGDVGFAAEFGFMNSSDLTQVSLGVNSVYGTGLISETFNGYPISGHVEVDVENIDYDLDVSAAGLISVDTTATGDFLAIVMLPPPDDNLFSTGDFVAAFTGSVDTATAAVQGELTLEIVTDDGAINETFLISVDTTASFTPSDFTLPDPAMASIAGMAWLDFDGDGQRDAGDESDMGRAGVTVELRDAATGSVIATADTNVHGGYSFVDVAAGDYRIGFTELPLGNTFTTADVGPDVSDSDVVVGDATAVISLAVGENVLNVDAGIVGGSPYQNLSNRFDVDGVNGLNLVDAFKLIDYVRTNGLDVFGELPEVKDPDELYVDVSGDGVFTFVDLFGLIDGLCTELAAEEADTFFAEGEGEDLSGLPYYAHAVDDDLLDILTLSL